MNLKVTNEEGLLEMAADAAHIMVNFCHAYEEHRKLSTPYSRARLEYQFGKAKAFIEKYSTNRTEIQKETQIVIEIENQNKETT